MFLPILLTIATIAQADVPPRFHARTRRVPADGETPGCYQTGELDLAGARPEIYWHIREYATLAAADAEAVRHRWAAPRDRRAMRVPGP